MASLPTVGGDNNAWGTILNTYLGVSLNTDGTMKSSAITTSLGYTPVNKSGDTGIGALSLGTSNSLTAGAVILGTNPASAGSVRLPNTGWIAARNAVNGADVNMLRLNSSNVIELGARFQVGSIPVNGLTVPRQQLVGESFVVTSATSGFAVGSLVDVTVTGTGAAGPGNSYFGFYANMQDLWSVTTKTVTGAANNGSGLIRITATAHGYLTGDSIAVYDVGGVTAANGRWTITRIDANTVDLQGSTFSGAYTSGGHITNRGSYYGVFSSITPNVDHGGLSGTAAFSDDINGFGTFNGGGGKATSGYLVNRNSGFGSGSEWASGFQIEANTDTGFANYGAVLNWGIDLYGSGIASYGQGAMLLPNNVQVYSMNAAGSSYYGLFCGNTINEMQIFPTLRTASIFIGDGSFISLGSSSGTKIGTGTTEKLAFYNSTPIVQPSGTTDLRVALINLGLYATGGASPLDLNGGSFTAAGATLSGTVNTALTLSGTNANFGIDLNSGTFTGGQIRLKNNVAGILARNAAGGADVTLFQFDNFNQLLGPSGFNFVFQGDAKFLAGTNIQTATSTGTKIATATTQLLGFWNATPVAQHSSTGETVGFTAGGGTTVTDASTFTGNTGTKAYRISDVVKALKLAGIMASS